MAPLLAAIVVSIVLMAVMMRDAHASACHDGPGHTVYAVGPSGPACGS
ncbi:hypothetical protein [Nocardioides sp. Kera G14]|nr:hypothetical protein [Nocardioides sp. Kera G14]UDY22637.1 hypothetical protein LH076_11190 [Nocardioides sp. Kera G14]